MSEQIRVLGVVPARGGSKGIPRKNIAFLKGKPLLAYTLEAARNARRLSRTVVSTEDEEIAEVARAWGAEVPFLRPAELATDLTESRPVVQHAVREMERREGIPYDVVVLLQPTTPLRTAQDIDAGIEMLLRYGADSVISVVDVGGYHPFRMKRVLEGHRLINYIDQGFEDMRPRQVLPPVYIRSGALYITRRHVLMEQDSFVGADCRALIIPKERAVNIDSDFDLWLSGYLLEQQEEHDENA